MYRAAIIVPLALLAVLMVHPVSAAEPSAPPPPVVVDDDGTVHVPAQTVPLSVYLSPEARAYVAQHLRDMHRPELLAPNNGIPRLLEPYLVRQRARYPVERRDTTIGGVHVYVYTPAGAVPRRNRRRVLIDLHGGGFSGCWPGCAELESIPVASIGKIEVVSVDYREAPASHFPAASEDVAHVYQALLKMYRPQSIGIYGCSAGGMLTAMSVAWFKLHGLPKPGAIGILCAGADSRLRGDSAYAALPLGEARVVGVSGAAAPPLGYLAGTDPRDPLVSPVYSPEVLAWFPPTLIVTGTRDFLMSDAVYTHSQLLKAGVDAELDVWEGLFHGFFYNTDVPESRDCYQEMVRFFDRHLAAN